MSRKALKNTNEMSSSHAPWASYNTPLIELIQYGCRIGKKVYINTLISSSDIIS